MSIIKYLEEKVDERRILNEASENENVIKVFKLYAKVFENLSDAFSFMNEKENVDGNGKVSGSLRDVEVVIAEIKRILKLHKSGEDKVKFDSDMIKNLGEVKNSLKILKNKIDTRIVPSLDVEPEPEFEPTDDETDEDIVK